MTCLRSLLLAVLVGALTLPAAFAQEGPPRLEGGEAAPGLDWMPFEAAMVFADSVEKPVIVDVYAPWCGWCTRLQSEVYSDKEVQTYVKAHFVTTRLNIDNEDEEVTFVRPDKSYTLPAPALAQAFGAQGTPTTVFLTADGEYITRLPGFVDASMFMNILGYIGSKSFESQTYQEYMEAQSTSGR